MEDSTCSKEKRKYSRILLDLPLEYRITDNPHAHGGLLVNASETGLLIHSVKDILIGNSLNIVVLFAHGFELENFDVLAEVIWKDLHWREDWEGYQYGLRLIRLKDQDYRKLRGLLNGRYSMDQI